MERDNLKCFVIAKRLKNAVAISYVLSLWRCITKIVTSLRWDIGNLKCFVIAKPLGFGNLLLRQKGASDGSRVGDCALFYLLGVRLNLRK